MPGTRAICYMTRGVKSNTSVGCYYLSTCFIIRFEANGNNFSCACSNVSLGQTSAALSPSLPLQLSLSFSVSMFRLHLWMVIRLEAGLAATATRTISHSSLGTRFKRVGKCVQRLPMCLTFVVCVCVLIFESKHTHTRTETFAPHCYVRYTFVNPSKSLRLSTETNLIKAFRAFDFHSQI